MYYEGWRREVRPEDLPRMCRSEGHSTGPPVPQDGGAWADQWPLGRWVAHGPPTRGLLSPVLCAYLRLPSGLEDVSKYPDLVAELLRRQWTEAEVRGALADNLLRVFEAVEQVRGLLRSPPRPPSPPSQAGSPTCVYPQASNHAQSPEEEPIPLDKLEASCRTKYGYSEAPRLHQQPGALLASLAPLLLSLCLL